MPFVLGRDIKEIKKDNMNLVSVGPVIHSSSFLTPLINLFEKPTLLGIIKAAKKEKVAIHLAPEMANFKGNDPSKITPEMLNEYTGRVLDWARFAEKYQVEYFSPMNETDCKLGAQKAVNWHNEILPEIRKVYTGKIYSKWGCYHDECLTQTCEGERFKNRISAIEKINLSSSFDGILIDYFPPDSEENFQEFKEFEMEDFITKTAEAAKSLNLPIAIGEFSIPISKPKLYGVTMPGVIVSVEEQAEFVGWYLDRVMPYYNGVIYCGWNLPGYAMNGKPVEEVIKEKFSKF